MARVIEVLFVCTANSARSVIAEYLLNHLGSKDFHARSAGTAAQGIHELTVRALAEVGIDASGARSRQVDEYLGTPFDYVITVCDSAAEACPVFPGGGKRLHWSFADPAAVTGTEELRLEAFRATVRAMRDRIEELMHAARAPSSR